MVNQISNNVIEHVFRHEYGKIMAILVHKFGPTNIENIEDVVQDALFKAMQVWGYKNIPNDPTAWLLRVSSNKLIDVLRREKKNTLQGDSNLFGSMNTEQGDIFLNNAIDDSQLKMIFACCNPALSINYQLILS